jgi:hypothetical protein
MCPKARLTTSIYRRQLQVMGRIQSVINLANHVRHFAGCVRVFDILEIMLFMLFPMRATNIYIEFGRYAWRPPASRLLAPHSQPLLDVWPGGLDSDRWSANFFFERSR